MGKRKEPMSEGKKNIIASLIQEYDVKTAEVVKKWSLPIRNWGKVYGELSIMYESRLPQQKANSQSRVNECPFQGRS